MEEQGIRHHRVTAKWPQAIGEVERQNSSPLKRLQIAHAEEGNWRRELTTYLAAYRSLSHPTTGVSPAELLFGRKMRTKLPELSDVHVEQEVRHRDSEQKSKSSDTPSAQGPARQQSAVQVANASELKVPNAVDPRASSATEPRAPVVTEPLESLRRSNRPRATPSYLED